MKTIILPEHLSCEQPPPLHVHASNRYNYIEKHLNLNYILHQLLKIFSFFQGCWNGCSVDYCQCNRPGYNYHQDIQLASRSAIWIQMSEKQNQKIITLLCFFSSDDALFWCPWRFCLSWRCQISEAALKLWSARSKTKNKDTKDAKTKNNLSSRTEKHSIILFSKSMK